MTHKLYFVGESPLPGHTSAADVFAPGCAARDGADALGLRQAFFDAACRLTLFTSAIDGVATPDQEAHEALPQMLALSQRCQDGEPKMVVLFGSETRRLFSEFIGLYLGKGENRVRTDKFPNTTFWCLETPMPNGAGKSIVLEEARDYVHCARRIRHLLGIGAEHYPDLSAREWQMHDLKEKHRLLAAA